MVAFLIQLESDRTEYLPIQEALLHDRDRHRGLSALLVAGFGIQDSISDIVTKQYEEIFNFDAAVTFDTDATVAEKADALQRLQDNAEVEEAIGIGQSAVTVSDDGEDSSVTVVVPSDLDDFADFTALRHRGDTEQLSLSDDGALITEKLAMNLGLSAGDTLTITDGDGIEREVKIADVVELMSVIICTCLLLITERSLRNGRQIPPRI